MKSIWTYLGLGCIVIAIVAAAGCVQNDMPENGTTKSYFFSFEEGMNGWTPDGTDLDDPPIDWSVGRTQNQSYSGNNSVRLYLNNMNDAGKIWMEKNFSVESGVLYTVNVSYMFGTTDYGSFNLFKIITGASNNNPEVYGDLLMQGDTGHHTDEEEEVVWLNKNYSFDVFAADNGTIYVNIGVWGTWETPRTYYIDDLNVTIRETSYQSLPDLEGSWTLNYYNWEGNVTKTENVSVELTDYNVLFSSDNGTLCSGVILKKSMDYPFDDSDYVIKGCDFGGLGIDTIFVYNESFMKTEMPLCENCSPAEFTR